MRKEHSFQLFFSEIFPIFCEIFSDFWPKNFKKLSNLPSACADEQVLAWKVFLKILNRFGFSEELWHGSQTSIYVSRVKIAEELVFFCFSSQNFFRILRKNFSNFWPKVFKKLSKLPSACADEQLLAWRNFQKFWTVLDFLQKPLEWFSKFYLRGQSKICRRISFFLLSSQNFFNFCAKIFQTFGQKSSRSCQNYLLRVQTNNFWLEETFKSFEPFWIFCRNLWHGSQNFIYVARVKFAEGTFFSTVLFRFFSNFHQNIFRLLAKKLQEVVKTTFRVCRWTSFGLKSFFKNFEPFWIFWRTLAWFSNFYLRVQSKNFGRISFFCFSSQIFFEFCAKTFQTFGQKSSRSCQNYLLRVQTNNFWLEETFKSFEPFWIFCRNLWHGSQSSI